MDVSSLRVKISCDGREFAMSVAVVKRSLFVQLIRDDVPLSYIPTLCIV